MELRPCPARISILASTGSNSGASVGLALHSERLVVGAAVGRSRRSLASMVAMTQSRRQSSHLALPSGEM